MLDSIPPKCSLIGKSWLSLAFLMAEQEEELELKWSEVAMPGTNAWTLSVLTAFLRLAADAEPFIAVTLGEKCPD